MNEYFVLGIFFIGMAIGSLTPIESFWVVIIYLIIATIFYIFGIIEDGRRRKSK